MIIVVGSNGGVAHAANPKMGVALFVYECFYLTPPYQSFVGRNGSEEKEWR